MSKQPVDILIQQEIDGVNSPAESKRLMKLIESSEAVKERYIEMAGLAETLGEVETVTPPASLKQRITAAVSEVEKQNRTRRERSGSFGRISHFISETLFGRPGYAFAAGVSLALVLVVVGVSLVDFGVAREGNYLDQVVGTLLKEGVTSHSETIDRGVLGTGSGSIELLLHKGADTAHTPAAVSILTLRSHGPAEGIIVSMTQPGGFISAIVNPVPNDVRVTWVDGRVSIGFQREAELHLVCPAAGDDTAGKLIVSLQTGDRLEKKEFNISQ